MSQQQQNIPELRFPEFIGEWETKCVKDILEIGSGKDYKHLNFGSIPVYGTGGLMTSVSEFIYDGESVCIGRKGTINKPFYINQKFWTVDTLFYTHSFKNVLPKFVLSLFQNINWYKFNEASGVPSLSKKTIEKIKINLPFLPEQQKIATFLSSVDKRIQALEQKKELLEMYKKGVMQKIFNREIRFQPGSVTYHLNLAAEPTTGYGGNNIYPDWEVKMLGDIGSTYNGLTGKTKEDFGTGKPYIQYKQIFDNSKIDITKVDYVNITEKDKQNRAKFGDVFFTTSSETPNEIGTSSVLLENIEEIYLNSFCFGFRPKSLQALDPHFSRYLFRSELFRRKIVKLAQGSTRYNMSKVQLLKLKVELPTLEEQQKIAGFLSAIDTKIEAVTSQIDHSKTFKKGLLQKMFV